MLPKVSVAIPSYNQKEFLRDCIESVLMQDYDNLEIIVSDDGSTDGTQELMLEYEAKYPGLFKLIFHEKNQGITANNNSAYFACTGKYMAWVDGDDLMLPGKIKKQVAFMEAHPNYVVCFHDLEVFDSETGKTFKHFYDFKNNYPVPPRDVTELVRHGCWIGRASQFFRLSACPPHGFDARMPRSADTLFMIETANQGEIKYLPETLARYRWHGDNVTIKIGGDYSLQLLTLAIIESKYPHFAKYTRLRRARFLYDIAGQKILNNQRREGRSVLIESLKQGWVSWKWFAWYLNSWFGFRSKECV